MTIESIERLVRRLEQAGVTLFDFKDETSSLTVRLATGPAGLSAGVPSAAPEPVSPAEPPSLRASAIGRLRLCHPEAVPTPDVAGPRIVKAGEIVAFLEAGPCLRPVTAERDGTIGPPLRPDGSLVGYGTPLFRLL